MKYGFQFFFLSLLMQSVWAATPLPVMEQSFQMQAKVIGAQHIRLNWKLAEGYFFFRDKFRFQSNTPGIEFGRVELPPGKIEHDDFFGDYAVYRQQVSIDLPLERLASADNQLDFSILLQGCLNIESCYPRQEKKLSLALPPLFASTLAAPTEKASESQSNSQAAPPIQIENNAAPISASNEDETFLDPEMAFLFSAHKTKDQQIQLSWSIAQDYYLYRNKLKFEVLNADNILGKAVLPPAKVKDDAYFGKSEVYYDKLQALLPLQNIEKLDHLVLQVSYQGCAEAGLCYPVIKKNRTIYLTEVKQALKVDAQSASPLAATPDADGQDAISILSNMGKSQAASMTEAPLSNVDEDEFLDPDKAFIFDAEFRGDHIYAYWQIVPGYYLYRHKFEFQLTSGGILGEPEIPAGDIKEDEYFGKVETYHQQVGIKLPVSGINRLSHLDLEVGFQGCADAGLCYPPTKKTIQLSLLEAMPVSKAANLQKQATTTPAENLSEQDSIAKTLKEGNLLWILLLFFGSGLLLSLTPCVFPMIPILSGIIVGQGKDLTQRKAFIMSLTYVLAMALTYTAVGVIAGLLGANLSIAFQTPWVLWSFALVFVALSLSMFGFYELQLPSSLQTKLTEMSNQQQGGTLIGVAIMGFLSALIVGPCVAAPLAGALIYISQSGDALLGGIALFTLSMGMGVPLLLVGMSAGKLLPRAGGWMDTVKYVFGVMLLATGVWMLDRILDDQITMLLYALLLIISAIYMRALDSLPETCSGWQKLWKGLAVVMLLYGSLLIIGIATGKGSLLQPLKGLSSGTAMQIAGTSANQAAKFQNIKGIAGLDKALAEAKKQNKPVILDFYADWCVSCLEMEHVTFSDSQVQQALADVVLLQADVTPNDELDKALLKKFGLFGPPGIIFYNAAGEEQSHARLVGFKSPEDFLAHLKATF
ncbi:protein-disulfide reductase DsbD [Candidatus Venteria ishoeyi]|uniref:Thiol:disulfide interchange protein DsbD n=1 Tax=Candidatus Venteria ishoeyi TaxID=1899563 RepID=A0A1H6FCB3_9GAMM|nr:protein-disulfide reductase DsbD [Candidatus Venteria ishoeyi]SEH06655.1 Thiol:disulfide interchange protein DsbD precursor [Candidatus Venteria ishoeyi]